MDTQKTTIHPSPAQALGSATTNPREIDLERISSEAKSQVEIDPRGGPPVVLVNWAAASVITTSFEKEIFWQGVALTVESSCLLLVHLARLDSKYPKAHAALGRLSGDLTKALINSPDGVAIVMIDGLSHAELKRVKCEERGHIIQHFLKRCGCTVSWYEKSYNRPEAKLFIEGLKRSGNTLYNAEDAILIVNEFAMKINNGSWLEYDVPAAAARAWISAYFHDIQQMLGRPALLQLRPVLIGRVAKEAFREVEARP